MLSPPQVLLAGWFQPGGVTDDDLRSFFVEKEREYVASLRLQLAPLGKPRCDVWQCGVEDVLLDSIPKHSRDRLYNDFPTVLRLAAIEMQYCPIIRAPFGMLVFSPQELIIP